MGDLGRALARRVPTRCIPRQENQLSASAGFVISAPNRACVAPAAGTPTLPATIGYVKVAAFSGIGAEAAAFANGIQRAIISADRDDLIGWIVDVRGNLGGNMWPMVAGRRPRARAKA